MLGWGLQEGQIGKEESSHAGFRSPANEFILYFDGKKGN